MRRAELYGTSRSGQRAVMITLLNADFRDDHQGLDVRWRRRQKSRQQLSGFIETLLSAKAQRFLPNCQAGRCHTQGKIYEKCCGLIGLVAMKRSVQGRRM
jgi:hypothetical protein